MNVDYRNPRPRWADCHDIRLPSDAAFLRSCQPVLECQAVDPSEFRYVVRDQCQGAGHRLSCDQYVVGPMGVPSLARRRGSLLIVRHRPSRSAAPRIARRGRFAGWPPPACSCMRRSTTRGARSRTCRSRMAGRCEGERRTTDYLLAGQ